jgi:hypothetical protein
LLRVARINNNDMPAPKTLRVGDKIRFIKRPDEWERPDYYVHTDDRLFMDKLIKRGYPARIFMIDEYGTPWVRVRLQVRNASEHHTWAIMEKTGWVLVLRK